MKGNTRQKIGFVLAIVGLALALIAGIFLQFNGIVILALMILGIIYGLLCVNTNEIMLVLVAAASLVIIGTAGFDPLNDIFQGLGDAVNWIVTYMGRLAAPAAVIAAVRALFDVAKSP